MQLGRCRVSFRCGHWRFGVGFYWDPVGPQLPCSKATVPGPLAFCCARSGPTALALILGPVALCMWNAMARLV